MSDDEFGGGLLAGILLMLMITFLICMKVSTVTAENYIKSVRAEAVELGYGKWVTDKDGTVWFEWVKK